MAVLGHNALDLGLEAPAGVHGTSTDNWRLFFSKYVKILFPAWATAHLNPDRHALLHQRAHSKSPPASSLEVVVDATVITDTKSSHRLQTWTLGTEKHL